MSAGGASTEAVRVIARFRPPSQPPSRQRGEPGNQFTTPTKRNASRSPATFSNISLSKAFAAGSQGKISADDATASASSFSLLTGAGDKGLGGQFEISYIDSKSVEVIGGNPSSGSQPSTPRTLPANASPQTPSNVNRTTFTLDRVFNPDATQEEVFETVARTAIQDVLEGYNGAVIAYGQTGSGKTHSMFGPKANSNGTQSGASKSAPRSLPSSLDDRGLIPRCAEALFQGIQELRDVEEVVISCSFLEIYNEQIRDLLNPGATSGAGSGSTLKLRETPAGEVYVQGLTEEFVGEPDEILSCVSEGERVRAVSATNVNEASSRSHAILILGVKQTGRDRSVKTGRLFLADLAGSERVGLTGAKGQTLEEAKRINQSLSALGNCISALTEKRRSHVPYRDSILTFLLKDSLGGNSKTTVLVCCSSDAPNALETQTTLRFAVRLKKMKNAAKVNKLRSVAELEMLLSNARKEIALATALQGPFLKLLAASEQLCFKDAPISRGEAIDEARIARVTQTLLQYDSLGSIEKDQIEYPKSDMSEGTVLGEDSGTASDSEHENPWASQLDESFILEAPPSGDSSGADFDSNLRTVPKVASLDIETLPDSQKNSDDENSDDNDDVSSTSHPPRLDNIDWDEKTGLLRGFSFVSPSFMAARENEHLAELRNLVANFQPNASAQTNEKADPANNESENEKEGETEKERALKGQVTDLQDKIKRLEDTVEGLKRTWIAHLNLMLETQKPALEVPSTNDPTQSAPPRIVRPLKPSQANASSGNEAKGDNAKITFRRTYGALGAGVATPVDASAYSIVESASIALAPVLKGLLRCSYMWLCKTSLFRRDSWKKILFAVIVRDDIVWIEQFKLDRAAPLSHISYIDPIVRIYDTPVTQVPGAVNPVTIPDKEDKCTSAFVSSDPKESFYLTSTCILRVLARPESSSPEQSSGESESTNPTEMGGPGSDVTMRSSQLPRKFRFELHDPVRRHTFGLAVDSKIERDLWVDFLAGLIRRVNEDGKLKVSAQQVAKIEAEAESYLRSSMNGNIMDTILDDIEDPTAGHDLALESKTNEVVQ